MIHWFLRELFSTYCEKDPGDFNLRLLFDVPRDIEVEGCDYSVLGLTCNAVMVCQHIRKRVGWSGDALYDWHTGKMTVPGGGQVVGSAVETGIALWDDYDGPIPGIEPDGTYSPSLLRRDCIQNLKMG